MSACELMRPLTTAVVQEEMSRRISWQQVDKKEIRRIQDPSTSEHSAILVTVMSGCPIRTVSTERFQVEEYMIRRDPAFLLKKIREYANVLVDTATKYHKSNMLHVFTPPEGWMEKNGRWVQFEFWMDMIVTTEGNFKSAPDFVDKEPEEVGK